MQSRSIRYVALLLAILIGISVCSIETDAQRRRKRRVRRAPRPVVTNPAIAPPGSEQDGSSERIISTADENPADATEEGTQQKKRVNRSGDPTMQQTIDALSNQVNRLNDKLSRMQETDRSLIDMERLTRAEQRAESVRSQMLDTESKLADLQARMDQVDYALKPENIDRSIAGYGTVHPEDARDTRRRQLENEKARLQAQITLLENSRTRLQASLSTAEAEVDLLRRRLDQQQLNNAARGEPSPTPDKP
jgi:predicted  nucleic acid-binding Zn-ribbon protein